MNLIIVDEQILIFSLTDKQIIMVVMSLIVGDLLRLS